MGMFVDEAWRGQRKSKSTSWSTKWTHSGPNLVPYANMECLLTLRSGIRSGILSLCSARVLFNLKLQLTCLLWLCGEASLLKPFLDSHQVLCKEIWPLSDGSRISNPGNSLPTICVDFVDLNPFRVLADLEVLMLQYNSNSKLSKCTFADCGAARAGTKCLKV